MTFNRRAHLTMSQWPAPAELMSRLATLARPWHGSAPELGACVAGTEEAAAALVGVDAAAPASLYVEFYEEPAASPFTTAATAATPGGLRTVDLSADDLAVIVKQASGSDQAAEGLETKIMRRLVAEHDVPLSHRFDLLVRVSAGG